MSTTAIAATKSYRRKVALAAANGTPIPRIKFLAFSTNNAAYDPASDTSLPGEFVRIEADVSVADVTVTATATLKGATVGNRTLRSIAAFASDGTLVGKRVVAPKGFEPETEMDFTLTFQY